MYIYIYIYIHIYTYIYTYVCVYNKHPPLSVSCTVAINFYFSHDARRHVCELRVVHELFIALSERIGLLPGHGLHSRVRHAAEIIEYLGHAGAHSAPAPAPSGKRETGHARAHTHTHTPTENNTPDTHTTRTTPQTPKRTLNNARRWRDDGACHLPRPRPRHQVKKETGDTHKHTHTTRTTPRTPQPSAPRGRNHRVPGTTGRTPRARARR